MCFIYIDKLEFALNNMKLNIDCPNICTYKPSPQVSTCIVCMFGEITIRIVCVTLGYPQSAKIPEEVISSLFFK